MPSAHSELFFNPGDKRGEANFIAWHHARHRMYDLLASRNGNTLPTLDLTGKIDHDWFYRHYIRHVTQRHLVGNPPGSQFVGLISVKWDDTVEREVWLRLHALEHADFDVFYGLP